MLVPHPVTAPAVFSLDQFSSTTVASTVPATVGSTTPSAAPTAAVTPITTAPATTTTSLLAPTSRVLMLGDSMAFDEFPAVAAALYTGKIAIGSYVSPGAGLLDTKYNSTEAIDKAVLDFHPDLVLYQASLWDFGTPDQQRAAYQHFTDVVLGQGARLALITTPPLRSDQRNDQLATLPGIMNEIARQHPGQVVGLERRRRVGPHLSAGRERRQGPRTQARRRPCLPIRGSDVRSVADG